MFANDYASNFNDVGCYIGGCAQLCNQENRDSHSECNALGYPGTNSGGTLLFEYNKFDNDRDGFDTNSQNNSDWPSPQNGACINGVKPPVKGAKTCWVLYHNEIYNNNENVPMAGARLVRPASARWRDRSSRREQPGVTLRLSAPSDHHVKSTFAPA